MKRCLLICIALAACTPDPETSKTTAAPVPPDSTPQASARIDVALTHDYELINEQRQWRNRAASTLPTKGGDPFRGQPATVPLLPALPEIADDSVFLRRACIDLAGRLPKPDEARAFLADKSSAKRAKLTEALVREPGAADVRFRMLAEAFRVKDGDETIGWLRTAAAEDRPYADIVAYMIGGGHMRQRDQDNAIRTSVETAYTVLGEDLYCAMCHDHPFNDHTQRECYEFAACFAGKNDVRLPADYRYTNGEPGSVVPAVALRLRGGWWTHLRDDEDQLTQISHWMVEDEQSRRFALVASLRVWNSLFGMPGQMVDKTIGGVDEAPPWHGIHRKPILNNISNDCFSASPRGQSTWVGLEINSPADFTQGTKVLIEEFLRCGGRLGEFQRILARTEAYQRSGIDYNTDWNGCYLAPAPQIRRLPSEVIWKVVSGEFDLQIPQVPNTGHPLRMLGRGTREWTDESLTPVSHELVRFMMNDKLVAQATVKARNSDEMFLEFLGRNPTQDESAAISRRTASKEDVTWALLNTREFMFRP
ncbi:MAG: DUF1549 domain-containing protein [Verrucomicrobiaceae bacterium]